MPEDDREAFLDALGRVAHIDGAAIDHQRSDPDMLVMARTPGYLIRRAQQLHATYWNEEVRDLTGPQYAVLAATLAAGVATHVEIGSRASLDSSSTRDIVQRLTDRGWLEPVSSSPDGRSRPVRVTSPAATAVRLLRDPVERVQQRVFAPLSDEGGRRFVRWLRAVTGVADDDTA